MVCGVNQRQSVCQLAWIAAGYHADVSVFADFSFVELPCQFGRFFFGIFGAYHAEKAFELFFSFQQRCEQFALFFRQRFPARHFVHQQVFCLFAVVYRIVHLVACQFVVFHKPVVRAFRKQKGRDVERIDQDPAAFPVGKQVFGVVADDIVSAEVVRFVEKREKLFF